LRPDQEEVFMRLAPRAASLRKLLAVPVLAALAAFAPAAPAQAESCTPNIGGIVNSLHVAQGEPDACAPQVGRPEGTGTGRKVG
jgi:hypothetical protein